MGRFARVITLLGAAVLTPATGLARGAIAGVVKDTSGAVLPGVQLDF